MTFLKKNNLFLIALFTIALIVLSSCNDRSAEQDADPNIISERLSDEELLDKIQYATFQYFWDGAEPNSGMARERYHVDGHYPQDDKHVVTTGGSGFGLMAIIAGAE